MRLTIHKGVAPEDWAECAQTAARFVAQFPETQRDCVYSRDDFGVMLFVYRTRNGGIAVRMERKAVGEDRP